MSSFLAVGGGRGGPAEVGQVCAGAVQVHTLKTKVTGDKAMNISSERHCKAPWVFARYHHPPLKVLNGTLAVGSDGGFVIFWVHQTAYL